MLARVKTLADVLAEHGVEVVETTAHRSLRQTCAGDTFERLWERGGEEHVRDVLACILESENNGMALISHIIVPVSRLLLAHRDWWERDASAWLSVFDDVNLLELHEFVRLNSGAASRRDAIAHELYRRLAEKFAPQPDTLFTQGKLHAT